MIISVFDRVENIVRKGDNAGYQHFLLCPQRFKKASFPDTSKGVIVWDWVNKSTINPGQPALTAQVDRGRTHLFLFKFMHVLGHVLPHHSVGH